MPVINSLPMLEEWLVACLSRNEALPAALHFDTGMNRLGFRLSETSIVRRMCDEVGYSPQMVMSHLACADQPLHEKNRTQLALFASVIAQFPGVPASLANSAATMSSRDMHFQMVRPGIALYRGRAVSGRRNPMLPAVPIVGRVSMDMCVVDLTDLQNDIPLPGEMVEVLGPHISVDDQADPAGTIGYEILTSLKGRYSRAYVDSTASSATG